MNKCVCDTCTECPFELYCEEEDKERLGNIFVVYSPNTKEPEKAFRHKKEAIRYCNTQRCKSLFDFYTIKELIIE